MGPGQSERRILEAGSTFLAVGVDVSAFFLRDSVPPWLTFLNKLLIPQARGEHDRDNPMALAAGSRELASKLRAPQRLVVCSAIGPPSPAPGKH